VSTTTTQQLKVCVIGAGPSGLTTIKQLRDEGHEVVCFDANAEIGGIWYRHPNDGDQMKVYDDLVLTISRKLMAFSDFMEGTDRTFLTNVGYLEYLNRYADAYQLRPCITFSTKVTGVRKNGESWIVETTTRGEEPKQHEFAAVAICTGPFTTPNFDVAGLENFTGQVMHSSEYRNNSGLAGKRILVVGLAESGSDIVREAADAGSKCVLAIRSYSFLLPRLFMGRYSTDNFTYRAHHHEMWARATRRPVPFATIQGQSAATRLLFFFLTGLYGILYALVFAIPHALRKLARLLRIGEKSSKNNLGQPLHPLKLDMSTEDTPEHRKAVNDWNDKSHRSEGNWSQRAIFSKNLSFIPALVAGRITLKDCGVQSFEGNRARFGDGTSEEFDLVILCTGFKRDFSAVGLAVKDNNVRNLYKHCFHPDHGGRLAVIGHVRPFSGGIPMCAEMQARYFAQLCSGRLSLPANLEAVIEQEKQWEDFWTSCSPRHPEALPSQIMFLDSIAKEVGCLLTPGELMRSPRLLVRHWFGSFNQACYRLKGPHAMPKVARAQVLAPEFPGDMVIHIPFFLLLLVLPHFMHPKNINI
jgi:dimethylaniline monooxygenase (N-oxide forming)